MMSVHNKKKDYHSKNPVRILNTFKKKWPTCTCVHNSLPNSQPFIICFNRNDAMSKSQRPESHVGHHPWMPGILKMPKDSLLLSPMNVFFSLLFVHLRPCFSLDGSTFCRSSVGGFLWAVMKRKSGKSSENIDTSKYHMFEIQYEWVLLAFRC